MPLEYFILKPDGEQTGTFSLEQIKSMLSSGFIDGKTRYWHEGITDWKSVERIDESLEFEKPPTATRSLVHPSVRPLPGIQRSGGGSRNWQKPSSAVKPPKRSSIPPPSQQLIKMAQPANDISPAVSQAGPVESPPSPAAPQVPSATVSIPPVTEEKAPTPAKTGDPVIETLPMSPMPTEQPKRRRVWVYVLLASFLILAVLAFFFVHRTGPTSFSVVSNRVTLTDKHVFVLLNQAAIKKYSDALRDSSVLNALKDKIATTTNPTTLVMLQLGVEKEKAQHTERVQNQFLASHDAVRIDPGTFTVLAYFDENGMLIDPRKDDAWVAITANGQPVYAFLAPAASPATASGQ